ncbi:MAG: sigma-70 family RNA polymerase sigma factor [Planctomycetes bacterium]|nr:sigma-70 family RNA polymerase sigma factor [Planctomycetota bacterium]
MADDSHELAQRASRGDGGAIDELLRRHLPGLRDYLRRHAGRTLQAKESTSDLVQSTCREILEHLDRFRYDGEIGFERWLYATALRKLQDRQRYYGARKRDVGRDAAPLADGGAESQPPEEWLARLAAAQSTASGVAVRREEVARLEAALAELPAQQREVVELAYRQQLGHAEIAARLGISAPNSRMILARALARLARRLAE